MFTPFWGDHVDSEACSIKEEFENHGFSDFLLSLMMKKPLLITLVSVRFIVFCDRFGFDGNQIDHNKP